MIWLDDKIVRSFGKSKTNLHGPPTQTGLDRFGIHGTLRGEAEHHSEGLAPEGQFSSSFLVAMWKSNWKLIWVWVFSGMNIHLPAILRFTRYQGFDPSPFVDFLTRQTWLSSKPPFRFLQISTDGIGGGFAAAANQGRLAEPSSSWVNLGLGGPWPSPKSPWVSGINHPQTYKMVGLWHWVSQMIDVLVFFFRSRRGQREATMVVDSPWWFSSLRLKSPELRPSESETHAIFSLLKLCSAAVDSCWCGHGRPAPRKRRNQVPLQRLRPAMARRSMRRWDSLGECRPSKGVLPRFWHDLMKVSFVIYPHLVAKPQ